ncbi:MAG: hypothetical protein H6Q21_1608 [Bacteroidetes bacterium]|nr:hypothetical protein [Bacteroidota bacterium]
MKKKALVISLVAAIVMAVAALAWINRDRIVHRNAEQPLADSLIAAPPVRKFGIGAACHPYPGRV